MELKSWKTDFIELAQASDALCYGRFELKSGRISPYFFNFGKFDSGRALHQLGQCYADAIVESGIQFDFLFGPAYKGIPLVSVTAAALYQRHALDVPWCFNRKEAKDHGEGGQFVGATPGGRALILDDLITAGTAIRQAMQLLRDAGAEVAGVMVGMDRQEKSPGSDQSAVMALQHAENIPVRAIVTLADIRSYLALDADPALIEAIDQYRAQYGVETGE